MCICLSLYVRLFVRSFNPRITKDTYGCEIWWICFSKNELFHHIFSQSKDFGMRYRQLKVPKNLHAFPPMRSSFLTAVGLEKNRFFAKYLNWRLDSSKHEII